MIKYLILSIVFLFIGTYSAIGQEVIATLDKIGLSTLNEELRKSAEGTRNNKSLVTTLQTTVNNLEAEFSITDGHTHDGIDSKKIDFANLINVNLEDTTGTEVWLSTGTTSWTAPTGVTSVLVTMIGGGRNGNQGQIGAIGSEGFAGADAIINMPLVVTPGDSYTVTVGTVGNDSVFGSLTATAAPAALGSLGKYIAGKDGTLNSGNTGGDGGGSAFGIGGSPASSINASGYGSSGAGGDGYSGAGGTGTQGFVAISY